MACETSRGVCYNNCAPRMGRGEGYVDDVARQDAMSYRYERMNEKNTDGTREWTVSEWTVL